MTDEERELVIKVTGNEHEIQSLKRRMDKVEEQGKQIQNLVVSISEMTGNIKGMVEEQKRQGAKLDALEKDDGTTWKHIKSTLITGACTAVGAGLVTATILALANVLA